MIDKRKALSDDFTTVAVAIMKLATRHAADTPKMSSPTS
jgi:hypothetical protein